MNTGCAEYRLEMTLLALRRRLADPGLTAAERRTLRDRIQELEQATGIDDGAGPV